MIDYYVVQNKTRAGSTVYHAGVTHTEGLDQNNFVKMLSELLNINEGEAKRVISGIGTTAENLLSQGWSFKIDGMGSFSRGITGSFPSPDASFNPAVNKIITHFLADKELSAAVQSASLNRLHGVEHGPIHCQCRRQEYRCDRQEAQSRTRSVDKGEGHKDRRVGQFCGHSHY